MPSPQGSSLNFGKKVPKIKWNREERVILCVLYKHFQKDLTAFQEIFSCIFKGELMECGIQSARKTSINTQWEHMKRSGDHVFGEVHLSAFDANGQWRGHLRKIKQTAASLGIDLREKTTDDINLSHFRYRRVRALGMTEGEGEATAPGLDELERSPETSPARATSPDVQMQTPPVSPPSLKENTSLVNSCGKLCYWCMLENPTLENQETQDAARAEGLPPVLYRWSNVDSQGVNSKKLFLAGLFADGVDYFSPEQLEQGEFDNFVKTHVSIEKSPTPFISTFTSMLAPLHRALRNQEGAMISIIDTTKLQSPVFSARDLVRRLKINIRGYHGGGEYLIWAKVPSAAIVCSYKASTLLKIANEVADIGSILQLETISSFRLARPALHHALRNGPGGRDLESGMTIGKLLSMIGVSREHCKFVSEGLTYSWRFARDGSLEEFHAGVEEGYNAHSYNADPVVQSSLPMTPVPAATANDDEDSVENEDASVNDAPCLPRSATPYPLPDTAAAAAAATQDEVSSEDESLGDEFSRIFDTPCPVPSRTDHTTTVELFDADTQLWVTGQQHPEDHAPSPSGSNTIDTSDEDDTRQLPSPGNPFRPGLLQHYNQDPPVVGTIIEGHTVGGGHDEHSTSAYGEQWRVSEPEPAPAPEPADQDPFAMRRARIMQIIN
ncbi:hypothetical protein P168DRAFT_305826 [Aspergillus campestris IBT 28561]|uniref:DUF7587 domain-containing protein n=1 Tax=Aspergillus campestris (strain IBT 28561) TaxID=1392248 RepID=A0A2I1CY47_ASPC2|nr:uncharacterized protein P168DRAFT_305826 [Aspergillus campestris IBT 28561]PKY02534.1 hypothetical protein P168DRAFT_305826 [Aspergillus campestris IBT 28561]